MIYLLQQYLKHSVLKYPQKIAIKSGEKSITYKALWEKSNRLANQLAALDFKPRYTAGIFLKKSIEAILAMFAILKAGGNYIPLDSYYSPLSRIKNIINLSKMDYLITNSKQLNNLTSELSENEKYLIKNMKIILVDNILDNTYNNSLPGELSFKSEITDDDLAYILFTSGSTGIPKGVMISHRNAITFVNWAISYFKPQSTDIFSNIAPLHFDLSVFDIFVSLASGASIHILPSLISNNPRAISRWIKENKITFFYSVPSIWISLLNYAGLKKNDFPSLSHILFAGEIFPPRQLKILMELIPDAFYFNLYGPTETNVCTYYKIKDKNEITDIPVPIGKACTNTEVIVLKEDDTEASINEQGELLVKGPGVFKGYYKNPESTKAVFKKSPLPYHHDAFFYKTGDIVRVIGPGCYRYVCRKDLMVKYSGFRIELQEIEHVLLKYQSVQEAIVVPVFNNGGTRVKNLFAFITTKNCIPVNKIELKKYLVNILPRYMIPDTINILKEIPKNGNGKADRRRLIEQAKKYNQYEYKQI